MIKTARYLACICIFALACTSALAQAPLTPGAVVGAGVSAVSATAAKGKQINVPAEARLIFALKAPMPMN